MLGNYFFVLANLFSPIKIEKLIYIKEHKFKLMNISTRWKSLKIRTF